MDSRSVDGTPTNTSNLRSRLRTLFHRRISRQNVLAPSLIEQTTPQYTCALATSNSSTVDNVVFTKCGESQSSSLTEWPSLVTSASATSTPLTSSSSQVSDCIDGSEEDLGSSSTNTVNTATGEVDDTTEDAQSLRPRTAIFVPEGAANGYIERKPPRSNEVRCDSRSIKSASSAEDTVEQLRPTIGQGIPAPEDTPRSLVAARPLRVLRPSPQDLFIYNRSTDITLKSSDSTTS